MNSSESAFRKDVLKGKVALVTGGATGINFGIAAMLGRHGASISIMGRRKEVLDAAVDTLTKQNIKAIGIQGDVRSVESAEAVVAQTVKAFGKIDILVNGAAGNFLVNAENLSSNGFKTVIEIDLIGTFNMSRAAFAELKKTKGSIINISATLHYKSTPWQIHSSAAKAGVDSITTSLAHEWGDFGIRVNGIAPGPIGDTEGMSRLSGSKQLSEIGKTIPLGRLGTVEDIGNCALFLVSPAASYISGDTIVVDGAHWLWSPKVVERETLEKMQKNREKKAKL